MATILHLTDLHFGWEGDNPSNKADRTVCLDSLLKELSELESPWKPTIVCITGDLGWRGSTRDYNAAKKWLDSLLDILGLSYDHLVISVGNHDLDQNVAKKFARPADSVEADEILKTPIAKHYNQIFSNYIKFCKKCGITAMKLGHEESYLVGERLIDDLRFVALNSAWFSKDKKDKCKLRIGLPHITSLEASSQLPLITLNSDSPITFALAHHPAEWFHEEEIESFSSRKSPWYYLAARCHVLLTGHTHGETTRPPNQIAEGARHFAGGSAYAGASHFNSIRLLHVQSNSIEYKAFRFDPRSDDNKWASTDVDSFPLKNKSMTSAESITVDKKLSTDTFRLALRADAERQLEKKSRLLKPFGILPQVIPQKVALLVSDQHKTFDLNRKLERKEKTEHLMSFYEAVRMSRRTLLLGDLGTGKSTLAAELVIETLGRSDAAFAVLIPVKMLPLEGRFTQKDLLGICEQYINKEVIPSLPTLNLIGLLEQHTEILLVFDGLDELDRTIAARLLSQSSLLPDHWATIQVVCTARPVELVGASFANWKINYTVPLDVDSKRKFLTEEMIADGINPDSAEEKASTLLLILKDLPALDSLANSPLAIRLIYPRLSEASSNSAFTLGDLLYELLLKRLGSWHHLDDKPHTFEYLETILPSSEAKAEFLGSLAQKVAKGKRLTVDGAKVLLEQVAVEKYPGANKYRLIEESLSFFEWLGLLIKGEFVEFPLQPLAEILAAVNLIGIWQSQSGNWSLLDHTQWRIISFAAAIARRRDCFDKLRAPIEQFIDSLLQHETNNVPAACYIVVESVDAELAINTIKMFSQLERRPLKIFGDERKTSAHNVAKTIYLAGEQGFDWLYTQYLDPKFPYPHAGSGVINDIFREWIALAQGNLTRSQEQRLSNLVQPYLATCEASFYGILNLLSAIIPNAFEIEDRLWYQSHLLDDPLLGSWANIQLQTAGKNEADSVFVNELLLHRAAESTSSGILWFSLNPKSPPPISIIRNAFRAATKTTGHSSATKLVSECRIRLGEENWQRFARWILVSGDNKIAVGAAIHLNEAGEYRLSILGDVLMNAMHDGGYVAEAEIILAKLIAQEGESGVRWLATKMANRYEWLGAHSGWWRILLSSIEQLEDGPDLLASCDRNIGPFTLARYPEIREAFSRILNGNRKGEFREALIHQLQSIDPKQRRGASVILVASGPKTESEALYISVRSRAEHDNHDWHEWETFCLTLDFSYSVLTLLKSRLNQMESQARAYALVLLAKGGIDIEPYHQELVNSLLTLGNWYLVRESIGLNILESQESFAQLIAHINCPNSKAAETAAGQLMELHEAHLSPILAAKCLALRNKPSRTAWELPKILIRIARDVVFAAELKEACQELRGQGAGSLFLELVLRANSDEKVWKDVVWAMLCDDSDSGTSHDADTSGHALLEYGLEVVEHQRTIGEAAKECLNDPRMKANRWTEAYQWLAVIADEFVGGLEPDILRSALRRGSPIYCEAAAALIARLGEVPDGVTFDRAGRDKRKRPSKFRLQPELIQHTDFIIQHFKEYSRDSDALHPDLLNTIEKALYLPQLDEQTLSGFATIGSPGVLIATTLRYCYGLRAMLAETIPLLDSRGKYWREDSKYEPEKHLERVWMKVRETVLSDDAKTREEYLVALDTKLIEAKVWKLPLALEILRIRGSLLGEQVRIVFCCYADHSSFLHDVLFRFLVRWLSNNLEESLKREVLSASQDALVTLNESDWKGSDGSHTNPWPYLLFPVVQWAFSGEASEDSKNVFLRGLKFSFEQITRNRQSGANIADLISELAPLLNIVEPWILKTTIDSGLEISDTAVRTYCQLIRSVAVLLESDCKKIG